MKQTIKYRLNPNFEQEKHLHNLSSIATKLYNTDNYQRRKVWDKTGKIPNVYTQKKALKDNHWFKLLPSQTAQEVIFNLQRNYNSWFKLRKKDDSSNPPMFRKKEMLSVISFYQQFKIIDDKIRLSMSMKYRAENKIKLLEIEFSNWKQQQGIAKFCQIIFDKGKWYAHIVYELPEIKPILNNNVMGVDLGIVNTAVTSDVKGNTKIYSGKQILSIQHYFNKEKAKLTSKLTKQYPKRHQSRMLRILQKKQTRQINQALHTHSKGIVRDCINKGIKILVVGDVKDIRKSKKKRIIIDNKKTTIKSNKFISSTNHGKVGNQKLHSWSFSKFTQQLEYKCMKVGIRFVRVNEAYTSQTCSQCGQIRKANRKHRGYYVCKSCGNTINADVNGSVNILKKYLQDFLSRSIGNVAMPSVVRITNVCPS